MSLYEIIGLSAVEVIGDFALKEYANVGGIRNLAMGVAGYLGVVIMLVVSLQGSTVLMVNNAWDGISSLMESIAAFIFLGERFDNYLQYIGVAFIILGVYFLKVPTTKKHPFYMPSL